MSYDNPIPCRYCDGDIYFDDDHISDSGKKIPMDAETEEPHSCPGRAYARERRQALNEDQNYTQSANERALAERVTQLEKRVKSLEDKIRIEK